MLRWLHRNLGLVAWHRYAATTARATCDLEYCWSPRCFFSPRCFRWRACTTRDGAGALGAPSPVVLTYLSPLFPWQPASDKPKAQWRLFGNSCLTSLQIAGFQKEPAYQPVLGRGRLLTLLEMLLTSTLAALFFLAVNRQFRR